MPQLPPKYYLQHGQAFTARSERVGVRMPPLAADRPEAVHAAVSDNSARTFSKADAAEPEGPCHVRVSCCTHVKSGHGCCGAS